jgi:hypothetical protein
VVPMDVVNGKACVAADVACAVAARVSGPHPAEC